MASASASAGAGPSAPAPSPVVRLEFEGPNHSVASRSLFVGQRVRVTIEDPAASAAAAAALPQSTDDELAATAKATVRYIGPVQAARDPRATMVGVEWDDAGRGKNDGSAGGQRYFTCVKGQGSFLHPERVMPAMSALTQAIADKYETRFQSDASAQSLYLVADHSSSAKKGDLSSHSASGDAVQRHIPVVFQGEEYMQGRIAAKLATLVDMTLTQSCISCAFDAHASDAEAESQLLTRKIPNVQTLDLTDNLVRDWREVGRIVAALPKLRMIALSRNNLLASTLPPAAEGAFAALKNLQVLVLNTVPHAWESVLSLAAAGSLPLLDELHLCKNQLRSLSDGLDRALPAAQSTAERKAALARAFPVLSTLELSFNELSSWQEVCLLERLPRLTKLLLNNNLIEAVESAGASAAPAAAAAAAAASASAPPPAAAASAWSALCSLGLNSNRLDSFASISALSTFPSLVELRCQANARLEELTMDLNSGSGGNDKLAEKIKAVLEADESHKIIPVAGLEVPVATAAASASSFVPTPQSASLLRLQLVARMPSLHTLNRSRITDRERGDAEKYYILVAFQARARVAASGGALSPSATGSSDHAFPRYDHLVSVHEDPAATFNALQRQHAEPAGSTLASKLVELHLVLAEWAGAAPSDAQTAAASAAALTIPGLHIVQCQTKKLSSSVTAQAARTMLEKAFKLAAHAKAGYALKYQESSTGEAVLLDEPLKPLNYYQISNGGFLMLVKK